MEQPALMMPEQTPSVLLKIQDLEKRFGYVVKMLIFALCGLGVEACIIYRLHTHNIVVSTMYSFSPEAGMNKEEVYRSEIYLYRSLFIANLCDVP